MQATSKLIPTVDIWPNDGQIPGLPKNPRTIRDEKFAKLVQSVKDDPEMLGLREILVFPYADVYVAIAGNMRLRACIEAGMKKVPCKIIPSDTPIEKLKAIVIKDNIGYGDNDWDALVNEWDEQQLVDWGMDMPDFAEEEPDDEPMKLETFRFVIEAENGTSLAQARIAIEGIIGDIEGVEIKG
ncbi:ParB/RepB/Spo0J family partition protein [Parapedobacter soli]|uniref:ParB/RepB/Spo0J family partition protein n=1 Tax=Parapedobacter soli TaxID=416955 RepID=UPI0021C73E8C|nr:ParB/RepB/Spo0J family partition protein [Parapedobacter soli]